MIETDELGDQPAIKQLRVFKPGGQTHTSGKRAVRKIRREDDNVDVLGADPGECAWYAVGGEGEPYVKVVPWERVIDVLIKTD